MEYLVSMDFNSAISNGLTQAIDVMGESITIYGATIKAVIDDVEMQASSDIGGDMEYLTSTVVVKSSDLNQSPKQKDVFTRVSDGVKFKIMSFNSDVAHYEFRVKRIGKPSRGT